MPVNAETSSNYKFLSKRAIITYFISISSYFALLVLLILSVIFTSVSAEVSRILMYSVKLIPLLIVLPGLLSKSPRAHIWLCFIVLFYFIQSVVNVWLSHGRPLDVLENITIVSIFISSMMFVRWSRDKSGT